MRSLSSIILTVAVLIAGGLAFPASAQSHGYASQVHVRGGAQIYAGPGVGFPAVEYVRFSAPANLHGCLPEIQWCDISTATARGWVPAYTLAVHHNQRFYDFSQSQNWYAYPVITFVFDHYWNNHYQNRDWYRHRDRYRHHHQGSREHRHDRRPHVDPRFRDGAWERDRNRDLRTRRGRESRSPRDDNRDYRGIPRRTDQENRDYRGLPRVRDRVGNPPRGPDVSPPNTRRPRPEMPSPDARRPNPVAPPQSRPRERGAERPIPPSRGRADEGRGTSQARQVE